VTRILRIHPDARTELRQAAQWYNKRSPGKGSQLVMLARNSHKDVAKTPDAWAVFPDWEGEPSVRSRHLPVFPYRLVYYADEKYLNVIAYAHESREPGYWRSRVDYWQTPNEALP